MDSLLERELARLTRAFQIYVASRGAAWGILAALTISLLLALLIRIIPLWHLTPVLIAVPILLLLGLSLGFALGWIWPRSPLSRLRRLDRRLNLADRLTTVWELSQGKIQAPAAIAAAQTNETLESIRNLDPRSAFPILPSRPHLIAAGLLFLALLPALFLPNPQEAALYAREAQIQAAREEAERLTQTAQVLQTVPELDPERRQAALQALEQAIAALNDPQASPESRQAALTEAERRLAELRNPENAARSEALQRAAPQSDSEVVQPLSEALRQGDMKSAADYLNSLSGTEGRPLTAQETRELADALEQMADNLQQSDPELANQFRDAAQKINNGDIEAAREALKNTAETLNDVNQQAAPEQALEQAQAQLQTAQEQLGQNNQQQASNSPQNGQPGNNSQQPGQNGQPGNNSQQPGQNGQPGNNGQSQGNGNGQAPSGQSGHHEDSGSSNPYGETSAPRIDDQSGQVTIPRQATEDMEGKPTTGQVNQAQVPYREVYGNYSAAAEAELSRRALPPAIRAYIRSYFDGLDN